MIKDSCTLECNFDSDIKNIYLINNIYILIK